MIGDARVPRALVGAGALTVLIGTFRPWVRSGSVGRSSYAIFELVERLGFSPDGAVGWALRMWPLVPLLLVLSVVVQFWSLRAAPLRASGLPSSMPLTEGLMRRGLPVVAALYAGGTAYAIRGAPDTGVLAVDHGPTITLIGSCALLAGALWPRPRPARRAALIRRGSGASAAS